ncbi:response regulator [Paenibacillus sp. IB182496]|uniref:Response regulator n=1 Tax=Paenibacillus sabuli TaxID=2772509 RepID=A0A927GST1_9BACL|nr:response regulator [Paenibacillus sabuli]MBD2846360.1 response regulator [Paenibacillus sabuli]
MVHILIVDDQKPIRDGLQAMLRQFPQQPEAIHCAASGAEALELLQAHPIQLVITDIRMPEMDGLELMARTRAEGRQLEYLIISGYGEFGYAQQAIGLGAKGYLLKPVKRDDLQTALARVMQELQTRMSLSRSMEQLSARARETERKELRMYMQGASYDTAWIEQTERRQPALWRDYRLCLLRAALRVNQPTTGGAGSIAALAERVYGREGCLCLQQRPGLVLAVRADAPPAALAAALREAGIEATVAVTVARGGLTALPESYAEATELHRHSYLLPERPCIGPDDIRHLERQWQLPYEELYALFQSIGSAADGAIVQGLSRLFRKETLQRYDIRYTEQLCRATVEMLEEYARVILPYMGEDSLELDALRSLYDYPGIRDYLQALQTQLLRLNQFYIAFKCSYRNSQDLKEAIRYIHEHYHKPLDLAMVSNHVSLNYAYFSNLFKKNVGKGFAEYLRDVRLDKARRLLAETDRKIVEIAAMVGYESYKSFTRAFRDAMAMQPTEYRQAMRQPGARAPKSSGSSRPSGF